MKIAVTSQNRREVTAHAGRCRKFWLYDIASDGTLSSKKLLELPKEQSFHDHARQAPHPLDTVQVLISAGMGHGLRRRLAQKGIRGLVTTESKPDKAVAAFLEGTLVEATVDPTPSRRERVRARGEKN